MSKDINTTETWTGADSLDRPVRARFVRPNFVLSRDGKKKGEVQGQRSCQLEGCSGLRLIVKWEDGKRTMPCTKGMDEVTPETWKIV